MYLLFTTKVTRSGINIIHSDVEDSDYESNTINIDAEVTSYSGNIEAVQLNYDIGDGWETVEMDQVFSTDTYRGYLSELYDGMLIKYYIMAVDSDGIIQTYPNNAPDSLETVSLATEL